VVLTIFSQTFDKNEGGIVETGDLAGDKYCGIMYHDMIMCR
jgi:hypothetical protein